MKTKSTTQPLPRARRPRGLSRLQGLTDTQLNQLNTWFDDNVPYRKMVDLCRTEFGREVPKTTLQRYFKRSDLRNHLEDSPDSQSAAAEISKFAATGDTSFSAVTLHLLEKQAFDIALASSRDADAEDLAHLQNLFHLIHKAKNTAIRERHAKVQESKCELRREELELKRQTAQARLDQNQNPDPPTSDNLFEQEETIPGSEIHDDSEFESRNENQELESFGPCPLPPEVREANARHAALLLSGQIETHYTRDPENSLFAKICQYQAPRSPGNLPATSKSTAKENQPTNLKIEPETIAPETPAQSVNSPGNTQNH